MLKRFRPEKYVNSVGSYKQVTEGQIFYKLPRDFNGGYLTLFVNGQMLDCQNNKEHPYGFEVNEKRRRFNFFIEPDDDDELYMLYDTYILPSFENLDWTKEVKKITFGTKEVMNFWSVKQKTNEFSIDTKSYKFSTTKKTFKFSTTKKTFKFNYGIIIKI